MELSLVSQSSLATEKYTHNGKVTNLHYVIKKHPIEFELALAPRSGTASAASPATRSSSSPATSSPSSFAHHSIHASLIYDRPDEKEVECIRLKPLEFKGIAKSGDPTRYVVRASIAVLSSQHEDMNFRARFVVVDSCGKHLSHMCVRSEPIQVISKPEVLDKKNVTALRKRKRTSPNESIMQALTKIQETQAMHTKLLQGKRAPSSPMDSLSLTFEEAFRIMVRSYADTDPAERPSKLRRVTADLDRIEEDALCSLVDDAAAQGYSMSSSPDSSPSSVASFDAIGDEYQDFVQTLVGPL